MKKIIATIILMFLVSGCYTQFEVIERPAPRTYTYSLDFYGYPGIYQHYWVTPYMIPRPPTKTVVIIKKENPKVETRNIERNPKKDNQRRNSGVVRKAN